METDLWIKALLALVLVTGLIGLMAVIAKKYMPSHLVGRQSKHKRVTLVETTYVDPKNKLVLIKRDDTEHLVLIGPNSSVIEQHISSPQPKVEAI